MAPENETAGTVASRLTVTLALDVPPALVAPQVYVVACWSSVMETEEQPVLDVIADSPSVTVHVTVTFDVYQPFAPSVPTTELEMTGGVLSPAEATTFTVNAKAPEKPLSLLLLVPSARTFTE